MKDQINTIREARNLLNSANLLSEIKAAVLLDEALTQLEAMAESVDRDGWQLRNVYFQDGEPTMHTAPVAQQPQTDVVPNVCASFYTESAELIGTTKAPIKCVRREDDGTLHVYLDHWPQQAEAVPQWLPIETAPRYGRILVKTEEIGMCVASAGWDNETPEKIRWEVVNDIEVSPTHWMPFPPPPSIRALKGQP